MLATEARGGQEPRCLYRFSCLLDAPAKRVAGALTAALLGGEPGAPAERGTSSARELAEVWIKEMSGSAPVPNLAGTLEMFDRHALSLGLRPLHPGDTIENHFSPRGALWTVDAGSYEFQDNKSQIYVEESEGQAGSTLSYKVQVYSQRISGAVHMAREQGLLDDSETNLASGIELRCYVRPCGERSELVREFLDGTALTRAAPSQQRGKGPPPGAPRPVRQADPTDECLKGLVVFLEEESRSWATAHGFNLLCVWRHVHCRINAFIWSTWLMSMIHCCDTLIPGLQKAPDTFGTQWLADDLAELISRSYCGKEEPDTIHTQSRHLTEGSVDISTFGAMLQRVCSSAGPKDDIFRRFVDLGSGRGNAVLAAHAMLPFRGCVGVEIQESSVEFSRERVECYVHSGLASFASSKVEPSQLFVQGDFFKDIDWSDASVVFVAALCLSASMVKEIAIAALRLQPGALLMILGGWHLSRNKTLARDVELIRRGVELIDCFEFSSDSCKVSWQSQWQQCNIYRRV